MFFWIPAPGKQFYIIHMNLNFFLFFFFLFFLFAFRKNNAILFLSTGIVIEFEFDKKFVLV